MYGLLLLLGAGVSAAYAMGGGGTGDGGSTFSFFIPILLLIVVFYFLVLRPQQKKEKERQAMIAAIKKGDRIITAGGLRGTVVKVYEQEKFARVEVAKGVEVDIAQAKIEAVIPAESIGHPHEKAGKIKSTKKG